MAWHKSSLDSLAEQEFVRTIGHRIALARIERGFSQYALADAANTARNMISDYECGKTMPTSYTLYKIADVLEVPMDSLCVPLD